MTKPTKWVCAQWRLRSAWTSTQSDQSSLSAWRKLVPLAIHWAHSEDWSDWADAQADLSLRWVHIHFVGFVMSWYISFSHGHLKNACYCWLVRSMILFLQKYPEFLVICYKIDYILWVMYTAYLSCHCYFFSTSYIIRVIFFMIRVFFVSAFVYSCKLYMCK